MTKPPLSARLAYELALLSWVSSSSSVPRSTKRGTVSGRSEMAIGRRTGGGMSGVGAVSAYAWTDVAIVNETSERSARSGLKGSCMERAPYT